jgi:Uma2 family endonuclease
MAKVVKGFAFKNVAELVEHLGNVPLERIRMKPLPGTATEKDALATEREPRKTRCELIDGVLVEKVIELVDALVEMNVIRYLVDFVEENNLGVTLGLGCMFRLYPGRIRIPDVCFVSWDRMPNGKLPREKISSLVPDLTVDFLCSGRTEKEMELKLRDYFQAETRMAWLIQSQTKTVEVYTAPNNKYRLGRNERLDGGDVLPGFRLPLKQLFELPRRKRG